MLQNTMGFPRSTSQIFQQNPEYYGILLYYGIDLRPIVPSRGLVTYGVAKVLTKILKPLVGKYLSTQDSVEQANKVNYYLWTASVAMML